MSITFEDICYLAIGTSPMQMQKLMSSVNGLVIPSEVNALMHNSLSLFG